MHIGKLADIGYNKFKSTALAAILKNGGKRQFKHKVSTNFKTTAQAAILEKMAELKLALIQNNNRRHTVCHN